MNQPGQCPTSLLQLPAAMLGSPLVAFRGRLLFLIQLLLPKRGPPCPLCRGKPNFTPNPSLAVIL